MTTSRLPKPGDFTTNPSEAALAYASQFLRFKSILRRADLMRPGRVDGIVEHTIRQLMWMAVAEEGESDWIARALHPGDMPPTTTTAREWTEATGVTSETFVDAAIGNGTAIADDTFIGIYGCQFIASQARNAVTTLIPNFPPVTAVRFVVGGTRVAEWDLYPIWKAVAVQGATSSVSGEPGPQMDFPVGIGESPIFITQNKTLLVQYYEQVPTTATTFNFMLHGIVVEKRGAGNGLNP